MFYSWEEYGMCLSPRNCQNYTLKYNIPLLNALNIFAMFLMHFFPLACSQPNTWQEELEFAAMRIEALKLARQITLSSFRSEVPVLCLPRVCECAQTKKPSAAFSLTR